MHAYVAAGAGFLTAVLWFDLMFDVQARRSAAGAVPGEALASISAYYRRVTTAARPMNSLIPLVMALTLIAIACELALKAEAAWIGWTSLILALVGIGLAMARTVRNARRLGGAIEALDEQTRLARQVYRDHQVCFIAMLALVALQLATSKL